MTLPSSGNSISMSQINTELGRSSTSTISLDTAENGGYATINTASPSRPNSSNPASMSEWFSYNHTAASGAGYLYIGDQDTDKIARIDLSNNTETAITVTSVSTGVSSLYHDGTNLWMCGKPDRKVFRLNGFSTTVLNTYDFSGNTDVNVNNEFVGLYVDTSAQVMYVCNFGNKKVIRTNSSYATTTNAVISLTGVPTAITIYGGNLYVCDWQNYQIRKHAGFTSTITSTLNLGTAYGRPYGLAFTNTGNMCVAFSGSPDRINIYTGFSTTISSTISSTSNWNVSPQGLAFSLV